MSRVLVTTVLTRVRLRSHLTFNRRKLNMVSLFVFFTAHILYHCLSQSVLFYFFSLHIKKPFYDKTQSL